MDKIFYYIKIIRKVLKAFPCTHVARELISLGVDRTTPLQVTEVVVVSKDSLLKCDMHSYNIDWGGGWRQITCDPRDKKLSLLFCTLLK